MFLGLVVNVINEIARVKCTPTHWISTHTHTLKHCNVSFFFVFFFFFLHLSWKNGNFQNGDFSDKVFNIQIFYFARYSIVLCDVLSFSAISALSYFSCRALVFILIFIVLATTVSGFEGYNGDFDSDSLLFSLVWSRSVHSVVAREDTAVLVWCCLVAQLGKVVKISFQ